jgi:hypothetical protein
MKQFLTTFQLLILLLILSSCGEPQGRRKAKIVVKDYMTANHKDYKAGDFGEFFEQSYPEEIQREIKTTEEIKYSIVHSYLLNNKKIKDEYFHLDKEYKILGQLSNEKMMKITADLINEGLKNSSILDSLKK